MYSLSAALDARGLSQVMGELHQDKRSRKSCGIRQSTTTIRLRPCPPCYPPTLQTPAAATKTALDHSQSHVIGGGSLEGEIWRTSHQGTCPVDPCNLPPPRAPVVSLTWRAPRFQHPPPTIRCYQLFATRDGWQRPVGTWTEEAKRGGKRKGKGRVVASRHSIHSTPLLLPPPLSHHARRQPSN